MILLFLFLKSNYKMRILYFHEQYTIHHNVNVHLRFKLFFFCFFYLLQIRLHQLWGEAAHENEGFIP